jgi:hypothetical protein
MATSVNQFLAAATANNIRCNNQWEAEFISGYDDVDAVLKTAVMFGSNFTIPGRTINYATVSYKGFEMGNLVPTNMAMENDHSMTIKADIAGEYRRAFLRWQNHVMNANIEGGSVFEGNRAVNPKSNARIRLFSADNQTVNEVYKLVNVVVTNVGPISLTYDAGDAATFDVTLKSTYWYIEKATEGALTDQV